MPALPVSTAAPSRSGSWNWPPAISPSWWAPSKKTLPPHSLAISAISRTGSGNRVMRRAERDRASACAARPPVGERVEVDLELVRVERDVDDVQAADAGRAVVAVGAVAADRLRDRHHRVAGLGQRGVDGHVADHARDQPVLGVVGLEQALEQLDAQRLDLVDVLACPRTSG